MEVRKIFRAGNSLVVSLPAETLQALNLDEGKTVTVDVRPERGEIVLRPLHPDPSPIDREYARMVEEFIDAYEPALKELAR